jgi:YVTN family beta-propeller protein
MVTHPNLRPWLAVAATLSSLSVASCTRPGFPTYPEGYREFAYVANSTGNSVSVLDLVYLRPDRTIGVGNGPVAEAVNPRRDEVYVVNSLSSTVSVIDTTRNTVIATIPVPRDPQFISVDGTGREAFVTSTAANSVTVLDLVTHRAIGSVAAGGQPGMAVISPDGRTLVVANRAGGTVALYAAEITGAAENGSTSVTAASAHLKLRATFAGCAGATSPVILPDSSKAFVACSKSRQVMSIWLAAAPDAWSAKQDASLLNDHLLALLNVGQNPAFLSLKPDGGEIFVSNQDSDSVSEIATQTNEVGSTYSIGNRPSHGLVSGDNGALWVSNMGAQAVSLYSIADGKFLSSIRTGLAPDALAFSADEHLLLAADTKSGDVAIIRTTGRLGPALFTILPAGGGPSAIVVKAMQPQP